MERIYHPFNLWEDNRYGMYEKTCFMDDHQMISDCESLLRSPQWLMESMKFVSHNWLFSAEQNLTNTNRNRQAWLGQAACCFSHGAPEYLTKTAWHNLSDQERRAANAVADEVIQDWEEKFKRGYFSWQKRR